MELKNKTKLGVVHGPGVPVPGRVRQKDWEGEASSSPCHTHRLGNGEKWSLMMPLVFLNSQSVP